MRATVSKAEIESELTSRFASAFKPHEKRASEVIPTGITQIDALTEGGLPRGAITEVFGQASSGRTSFMLSALAHATRHEEVCALIDTNNVFDPQSATQAQMNIDRLLWIRCAHNLEHAFKATDLLLQAGGFGLVMLDLGDVPAKSARRIISSWWYRFRRTLEATPTALMVIAEESCVGARAALGLELKKESGLWSTTHGACIEISHKRSYLASVATMRQVNRTLPFSNLLQGLSFQVECRRPLYLQRWDEDVLISATR